MRASEQTRPQALKAMARWQDFPVHADPRPLVLTGQTILFRGGFPTSEAKDAFLHGAIDGEPSVPHTVVEIFRRGVRPTPALDSLRSRRRWTKPPSTPTADRGNFQHGASNSMVYRSRSSSWTLKCWTRHGPPSGIPSTAGSVSHARGFIAMANS